MNARKAILYCGLVLLTASVFATDISDQQLLKIQHSLVSRKDVQHELEMTDEQIQALRPDINAILKRRRDRDVQLALATTAEEFLGLSEDIQKERRESDEAKIRTRQEVLLPHQLKRLEELAWQDRGLENLPQALDTALRLKAEERLVIAAKDAELQSQLTEKTRVLFEKSKRELLEILTPEQQREWQEKVGAEFEFVPDPNRGPSILRRLKAG